MSVSLLHELNGKFQKNPRIFVEFINGKNCTNCWFPWFNFFSVDKTSVKRFQVNQIEILVFLVVHQRRVLSTNRVVVRTHLRLFCVSSNDSGRSVWNGITGDRILASFPNLQRLRSCCVRVYFKVNVVAFLWIWLSCPGFGYTDKTPVALTMTEVQTLRLCSWVL